MTRLNALTPVGSLLPTGVFLREPFNQIGIERHCESGWCALPVCDLMPPLPRPSVCGMRGRRRHGRRARVIEGVSMDAARPCPRRAVLQHVEDVPPARAFLGVLRDARLEGGEHVRIAAEHVDVVRHADTHDVFVDFLGAVERGWVGRVVPVPPVLPRRPRPVVSQPVRALDLLLVENYHDRLPSSFVSGSMESIARCKMLC